MDIKGKKIVVTGSAGFIGSRLVVELKKKGAEVIEFDIKNKVDLTKWETIPKTDGVDIVYHLAALIYVPYSFQHPRETYFTNIGGTINILELCRSNDARMILASSYVYGNSKNVPIDENCPIAPTNPYTRSKAICEELCRSYHNDHGISCTVLRPFNVYGEGQDDRFLIPYIIKQIEENGKIVLDDPNPKRDFLYVDDMVNAYIKAGKYDKSKFEIINIGYGKSYSIREVVDMIVSCYNRKIDVTYLNKRRKGEVMDTVADISKAERLLGWEPKVSIKEGLRRMVVGG
jgi:UDP-glucose 4-epimerase